MKPYEIEINKLLNDRFTRSLIQNSREYFLVYTVNYYL